MCTSNVLIICLAVHRNVLTYGLLYGHIYKVLSFRKFNIRKQFPEITFKTTCSVNGKCQLCVCGCSVILIELFTRQCA